MCSFELIDNTLIKNNKKCKQLNKQNIYLDKINKIAFNPFDGKRYWIDNINSVPYGHIDN